MRKATTKKAPKGSKKPAAMKAKKAGPGRFKVALRGGTIKPGSDSFALDITGFVHVKASSADEAREIADAVIDQMAENGELIDDNGLELEIGKAVRVRDGDVEEIRENPRNHGLGAPEGGTPELYGDDDDKPDALGETASPVPVAPSGDATAATPT